MNKVKTGGAAAGRRLAEKPAVEVDLVRKVVATKPSVREELVAKLQASIRAGEYNPPSEDIAERMLLPSPEIE
ncbi:MAG TPA: flagellar biosynthesis anti-sigma factor FlgM [Armatimonadota bacterium]|jgi:anti-sigma28 factor (negative regulator of flagellin synthesis)